MPARTVGILSQDRDFLLPVLKRFLLTLKKLALKADQDASRFGDTVDTYQKACMSVLQRLWAEIFNDDEKNFALIAIYTVGWQFAKALSATTVVSKWRLPETRRYKMPDTVTSKSPERPPAIACSAMLRAAARLREHAARRGAALSKRHTVRGAGRYYQGVSHFQRNNWYDAAEELSFALRNIPPQYRGNRRRVLWRLIPAKLHLALESARGVGSPKLFADTDMPELGELSAAFARGDVRAFEANLERHEELYVREEVHIQLLKLRMLLYRNLIKRCYLAFRAIRGEDAATKVPLMDLHRMVVAAGWAVEVDELECLIGRLIELRPTHMRGTLDSRRRVILFPRNKPPFPSRAEPA